MRIMKPRLCSRNTTSVGATEAKRGRKKIPSRLQSKAATITAKAPMKVLFFICMIFYYIMLGNFPSKTISSSGLRSLGFSLSRRYSDKSSTFPGFPIAIKTVDLDGKVITEVKTLNIQANSVTDNTFTVSKDYKPIEDLNKAPVKK